MHASCTCIDVSGHRFVKSGTWDSIHVVEVAEEGAGRATYKLTTTIMLHTEVEKAELGDTNLSGSLTRQVRQYPLAFLAFSYRHFAHDSELI